MAQKQSSACITNLHVQSYCALSCTYIMYHSQLNPFNHIIHVKNLHREYERQKPQQQQKVWALPDKAWVGISEIVAGGLSTAFYEFLVTFTP